MNSRLSLTVAIPTYRRGEILLQTVRALLKLEHPPAQILIVDQTEHHPLDVETELQSLSASGSLRIIRLAEPSIPHAMNIALLQAANPIVLFVDDDVDPAPDLAEMHLRTHEAQSVAAVVGQILQPGESPAPIIQPLDHLEFHFNSSQAGPVRNVMAGNLSVSRQVALDVGGFDESFVGAAYRFETDFAYRLLAAGHGIWFAPEASLRHLKLSTGGLRALGDHLRSPGPQHSVGDYYFALRHLESPVPYMLRRLRRNLFTRYHLRHPWTIPSKAIGELRGLQLARKLTASGPRLLPTQILPATPNER